MSVFVKICGICSRDDLEQISAFRPDAIGFIQWPKSKRYIAPEVVGEWGTPSQIKRVGVFVNPTEDEVISAVNTARLDIVQLYRISPDWNINATELSNIEFWKAINFDEENIETYIFPFDRFLIDSYDPKTIGGTGKTCDWNQAADWIKNHNKPVLLAGGLTPENVSDAIKLVQPWGVDVSSGVEIEPGEKDLNKVKNFIENCR